MKFLSKLKSYLVNVFDKESTTSSKRIAAMLIIGWAMLAGSYFVYKSFEIGSDGQIPTESSSLIQYAFITGASLLTGGTLAEALKKK